jgi:predicted TIM-barrel fold metal-dependent hydrolase
MPSVMREAIRELARSDSCNSEREQADHRRAQSARSRSRLHRSEFTFDLSDGILLNCINMNSTRREFLTASSAAIAGVATGCTTMTSPEERAAQWSHWHSPGQIYDLGWIDAHVHVWTPDTLAYPLAEGYTKQRMAPPSYTPEELFAQCRPQGVSRIVLIQMSFYKYDNSYMLAMMRQHPGVVGGVAIIDENSPDVRNQMQSLAARGVRGFRLYTNKENSAGWATSAGMKEMWKTGAELGMAMCCLANPDALPNVAKMCTAFPDTPVVIDHFARIGVSGSVNQPDLDQLLALSKFKNTYVKTSAFYALGKKAAPYTDLGPMIRQLRDAFSAKRLMWATDCPFQSEKGHTYGASIELIRDRLDFLTEADRQWMLRKTAESVFFA